MGDILQTRSIGRNGVPIVPDQDDSPDLGDAAIQDVTQGGRDRREDRMKYYFI
jgi:hypothetical protein